MSQRTLRQLKRASVGYPARTRRPAMVEPLELRTLLDGQNLLVSQIGQWGGAVQAVEVVGTTGYLAQGPSLVVMDLSDPANPQELGRAILPDLAQDVSVVGSYAYVADDDSGLQILNISNPAAPTLVGTLRHPRLCLWRERGRQLRLCGGRLQRPADPQHQQSRRPDAGRQLRHQRVCLWRERGGQLRLCGGRLQRPADHQHQQSRRPDAGRHATTPPGMPLA